MTIAKEKFGIVLPIILLSYFMILLDNSIIFTSTVKISQDLNMDAQTLAWVSSAYSLTFGGFQLFGGRIGDIIGRKTVFLVGLTIFSTGSLLVGLATNAPFIIAMRAYQGIGAAILAPTTLALLMDNYEGTMRTRAIAAYGATAGIGGSLGLVIGGLITSELSWRYGFFLNVPVGLLLITLTVFFVGGSQPNRSSKIDILGTLLSIIGLSALVYSIDGTSHQIAAFGLAIVFLALFVLAEARTQFPMMPLRLFAARQRSCAYITRFLFMGASFAYFFVAPQAMQDVYHFTPLMAGLAFLPATLPQFFSAMFVSRLSEKFRNAQLILTAVILMLIFFATTSVLGLQYGYVISIGVPMLLFGLAHGLALSPLTIEGVANTDSKIAGAASGVVNTVHQFGQSVGMSLVVALTSHIAMPSATYRAEMMVIFVIVVIALIPTLGILKGDHTES